MIVHRLIAYDKSTECVAKTIDIEKRRLGDLADRTALEALETTYCSLPIAASVVVGVFGDFGASARDFDWFLEPFVVEPARSDDHAMALDRPGRLLHSE